MNLIIDVGNSSIKFGLFEGNTMVFTGQEGKIEDILKVVEIQKIDRSIFSSVRGDSKHIKDQLNLQNIDFLELKSDTPIPLTNSYETPETLGMDRIAVAVGAHFDFPENNILVIDAGTAITFELVNKDGCYLGGAISPGLDLRFKALHQFTGKLPLVKESNLPLEYGANTISSLQAGVQNGIVFEIEGYIAHFSIFFSNFVPILTGGNGNYLHKIINQSIILDPYLLLKGLNRILQYNDKK